ncbi:MAG: hypothetical protein J6D13_10740 [Clostridium sp.]|nr:hypothetical protein [Clostridium sp.]
MLHVERTKQKSPIPGLLISAAAFAAVLYLFVQAVDVMQIRTQTDRQNALSDAIRRASVQCYAIEGRYPPSVEYLEEHYGIVIDRSRCNVFYSGWASNVMPDITVIPVTSEEGGDLP